MEIHLSKNFNLIKNRNYLFIIISSLFSGMAISFYLLTEQWYVLNYLGLKTYLGVVMMTTTIPRVIFMALGGVIADRFKCSKIMALSSLIRACLLILMFVLYIKDSLNIFVIILAAFIFGTLDSFFWPSRDTILSRLVPKQQLSQAISFMQTINQLTLICGPLVGGILLEIGSYSLSFLSIGLMLLTSSILSFIIREKIPNTEKKSVHIIRDLKEGISYVLESQFLKITMLIFLIVNLFFIGPLNIGAPIIAKDILGGNSKSLSYILSAFSFGMILCSLILGVVKIKRKRGLLSISFIIAEGFLFLLLSQTSSLIETLLYLLLIGFSTSAVNIFLFSLIQETTNPEYVGRVISLDTTVSLGLVPLSYGLVSLLISYGLKISTIYLISGTVLICFSVLTLLLADIIRKID